MVRRLGLTAVLMTMLLVVGATRVVGDDESVPFSKDSGSALFGEPPTAEELPAPQLESPEAVLPPIGGEFERLPNPNSEVIELGPNPAFEHEDIQRLPPADLERLPPIENGVLASDPILDEALDASEHPSREGEYVVPLPLEPNKLFDVPFSDLGECQDGIFVDGMDAGGQESSGAFVSPDNCEGEPLTESLQAPNPILPIAKTPALTEAWWQPLVSRPMRRSSKPLPVSLQQLLAAAVCYSDQIKVYSDSPLIRDMIIVEEDAAFDWVGFTENLWNDISEPVGSTLTTGGPPRFSDERVESRWGLRRRSTSGGRFEVTQEFGHQNSNSVFFQPNNQGTSQLTLNYTQPLLRGAGRVYNSSLIVLAQMDAGIARDEFSAQLQTYLLDVTNAYWTLFQQRAALLQKERLFKRGHEILQNLENRTEIDALASQIVRARAAVAIRRADLYRAATQVKNAESRIRALVNAPQLGLVDQFELLPSDAPGLQYIPVGMAEAMTLAIQNRPELHQAVKRIKAAAVRKNMSSNELLPAFDLILETYVRGLRGESEVLEAFGDSFSDGAPSYTAGFQMEIPLGNRAARAAMRRREIEFRQLQSQFRATVDVLQLEVEVVVREVETAHLEIKAKHQSMVAAQHEVEYLMSRWTILSGEDRSASLLLEDLLAAQERLANEELGFLSAQITYNQALTDLKQVTGSLLQLEQVDVTTSPGPDGNPVLRPSKRQVYPTQQVSAHQVIADPNAARAPLVVTP